ncbi:beta-galactosidase GalB [Paludibacter jiangxiensis]|uniref:Beta-galactosidase n=1 Tax=Paludibacter jiangxiensis TaxID=681398 RepID=A0A171ADW9_9BACT|nr:beta-galactosidase GalB [Paludibacter jiangxiensis]GAT63578.1 beta-galactosidase [Paludibacter jiangxiensis]
MKQFKIIPLLCVLVCSNSSLVSSASETKTASRQRISINDGWHFFKYESGAKSDKLIYDVRPEVTDNNDSKAADSQPTEAIKTESAQNVLKSWILPTGNPFIKDPTKRYTHSAGNPGGDFPFVQSNFDDKAWETVNLPHDWAIKGPFQTGSNPQVGGGMGRLPVNGVAWYRKKIDISAADAGKSIFLDIDGAMSYAIVWCNGKLVGGWPYGYNSWRVDLTPYVLPGKTNQLAIRVDNPNYSARWYPGAGLYRNVWLVKTNPVHVSQYGTYITTKYVTTSSATINLETSVENKSNKSANIDVITQFYSIDDNGKKSTQAVASLILSQTKIAAGESDKLENSVIIDNPKLWGPSPTQKPNLYVAVTTLLSNKKVIDTYETRFGIRNIEYNPDKGLLVNGEHVLIKGVNQHHDLGALGSAFNTRAAERQLEILREMGCNAIRFSHNPPAPELLELTDKMGFLVIDEIFDSWERKKTPHDFHLIFPDWAEQDVRAFVRRDRNCPSIIMWSFGNEVGEQYTGEEGAQIAARLRSYIKEEDPTRPTTGAMNYAKPDMPLPAVLDVIGLNYQGEGIRQDPVFEGTDRIRTAPQYDPYHLKFPDKMILSTETASAASSRGVYLFPVSPKTSAPIRDGEGGDSKICQVSSYELHAVDFGSSADKVFNALDHHPFVAGEFVWNGFDYLGEPTPYYEARSSYTGIIDLAGFKKERFYLYQAHWRPELPMAHILPHWNWPDRMGQITPVHVFTSGDEAELFLNGTSLGRKVKGVYEYRLRWDSVRYEPGELKVIVYKNGNKWEEETVKTTASPSQLTIETDRSEIQADGKDLSFITVKIADRNGLIVPVANNQIEFSIDGPGEILATDNGDPTNMIPFPSQTKDAFNGLCLVIVRSKAGAKGNITLKAKSAGLTSAHLTISSK